MAKTITMSAVALIGAHIAPSLRDVLRAFRYDLSVEPTVEINRRLDINSDQITISFCIKPAEQV